MTAPQRTEHTAGFILNTSRFVIEVPAEGYVKDKWDVDVYKDEGKRGRWTRTPSYSRDEMARFIKTNSR